MLSFQDSRPIYFGIIPMRKHASFAKSNKSCNITRQGGPYQATRIQFHGYFPLPKEQTTSMDWICLSRNKLCTRPVVPQNSGLLTYMLVWFLRVSVCFRYMSNGGKSYRHRGSCGHKQHRTVTKIRSFRRRRQELCHDKLQRSLLSPQVSLPLVCSDTWDSAHQREALKITEKHYLNNKLRLK